MSNYIKNTNYAVKDGYTTGNPNKVVKGTELDTEFNDIATAIATKADTASPTFTGTPTAPTAALNTNTTQLATTAFVVAEAADAVTDERTATATLTNKTLSSPSLTSPSMSTIVNTGTLTLPTSTDTVVGRATTDTLTNKTIALGSNTVSGTKAQFNTAVTDTDISFLNDFTGSNQSLTTNGYQKLPGGLIIQWGRVTATDGTATSFPIAFPTACLNVTLGGQGGAFENIYVSSFTTTTVTIFGGYSPPSYWMAIGY